MNFFSWSLSTSLLAVALLGQMNDWLDVAKGLGMTAGAVIVLVIMTTNQSKRDDKFTQAMAKRDGEFLEGLKELKGAIERSAAESRVIADEHRRVADGLTRVMTEVVVMMRSLEKSVENEKLARMNHERDLDNFRLTVFQGFARLGHELKDEGDRPFSRELPGSSAP